MLCIWAPMHLCFPKVLDIYSFLFSSSSFNFCTMIYLMLSGIRLIKSTLVFSNSFRFSSKLFQTRKQTIKIVTIKNMYVETIIRLVWSMKELKPVIRRQIKSPYQFLITFFTMLSKILKKLFCYKLFITYFIKFRSIQEIVVSIRVVGNTEETNQFKVTDYYCFKSLIII